MVHTLQALDNGDGIIIIKNTTPKTTSNALQLRSLLIFFGMLLYGLWAMTRYENYGGLAGEKLFTMDYLWIQLPD